MDGARILRTHVKETDGPLRSRKLVYIAMAEFVNPKPEGLIVMLP